MSVQITLAFDTTEEAIVALGKLAGIKTRAVKPAQEPAAPAQAGMSPVATSPEAPAAAEPEKKARKPRADKGQPREPYGPRNQGEQGANAAPQAAAAQTTPAETPPAAPSEPAAPAPTGTQPAPSAGALAAAVPAQEEVQKAVEKLFNAKGYDDCAALLSRFGVKRGKDLREDQRADFIRRVNGVIAGEAI